MGYTPRQMLGRSSCRHALPDILTGMRIALGFSFVVAISAEMIASNSGIGKLIFMYGENGAYDYMFAAVACVVAVAFLADRVLLWATRRMPALARVRPSRRPHDEPSALAGQGSASTPRSVISVADRHRGVGNRRAAATRPRRCSCRRSAP